MSSSAPAAPRAVTTSPVSFPELLNLAMTARDTRDHAQHLGIDETALIRYADRAVCDVEHREITGVLAKNKWALDFVVNRIKQRRGQPQRRVA